jgi:hypothetical protein
MEYRMDVFDLKKCFSRAVDLPMAVFSAGRSFVRGVAGQLLLDD